MHLDNAKEFIYSIKEVYIKNSIIYTISPPNIPYSNRFIKRINRIILNKVRALLFTTNLPKYLYGKAVSTIVYLYNRSLYSN